MKKIFAAFALSILVWCGAMAQTASVWKSAEDAYAMGDFDGAIKNYESLLSSGASSASLFYNLGNAYYRKGIIGKSILNYERALKLDPSDDFSAG